MSGIAVPLTSSTRSNLLSLKSTTNLLSQTQLRLSTGKKVNTASDNAAAFFASQGFLQRASDFGRVKESLGTAVQTLQAASNAIDGITKIVNQAQGLATAALQTTDTTVRLGYATQFNGLLTQINNLVADATFNGTNLLSGAAGVNLVVNFNESAAIELTVASANTTASAATGLNIALAAAGFVGNTQINASATQLTRALNTLRTRAADLGTNVTIISTRQSFTDGLINTLQTGSDNLVLADTNEEGANLQALQASLQLGIVSLGISGQQQQAILRLF